MRSWTQTSLLAHMPIVLARAPIALALALYGAASAGAQTVPVTPDTAPPPLINVQNLTVDSEPGNQFDPHVTSDVIVYTRDAGIRYFRPGVDAVPQNIPMGASFQDLLPDAFGTRITFTRVLNDRTAAMVFDTTQPASATNPYEVSPAPGVMRFSVVSGGNTLAYIESDLAVGGELVVYDLGTASVTRLTNDAEFDSSPNVSTDGNTIVWQHCATSYTLCDIWKAVKSGTAWTVSVVSSDPADEELTDTNGGDIVYYSDRPSGAGDIFFRDTAGTEHELLLPGTQINPNIAGDFVVFESRDGGPGEIDLYQLSTNRLWPLTATPLNEELDDVAVLPTGELLVVYDSDEYGFTQRTVHALRIAVPSTADTTPPSITILAPADGQTYTINASIAAQYSCADDSGISTCQGPVARGAPFATVVVGAQTFTVNAADLAGNTASQTVHYAVAYDVCPQYDSGKAKKSGSTYPIRIALCDAAGQNVSSSATVVHATGVVQLSTQASGALDDAGNSNADFDFRYDAGTYVFNLKTTGLATGTYALTFTAGADPTEHLALFQIK